MGVRWCDHCCSGKAKSIACCECVCVCVGGGSKFIEHAIRMRHVLLSSVARLDVPYFSSSHKRQVFREKVAEHKMCCDLLYTEIFLILRRYKRDIITNVHRVSCKLPVVLVRV